MLLRADGSLLLAGNYADTEGPKEPAPMAFFPDASNDTPSDTSKQKDTKSSFVSLAPEEKMASEFGGVKKIVLGYNSIYVIASDGRLWVAGSNRYGQLSLGFDTEISPALKLINP